jgi:PAS domain S-box-containing protein
LKARHKTDGPYRNLVDLSPDAILVQAEGRLVFANAAAAGMIGARSPQELIGRDILQLVAPADRKAIAKFIAQLQSVGEAPPRGVRLLHLDEGTTAVEVAGAVLEFDGRPAVQLVGRKVRGRRLPAGAFQASKERFRALVAASSDVLYRMSADWSEMLQLRSQEFLAETNAPDRHWLARYIPEDVQRRILAVIDEAIRTRSVFELEHPVLRADGSRGWTFSRAIPVLDAKGEIVEWFGAASDITDSKGTEEALYHANLDLQASLAEARAVEQELAASNRALARVREHVEAERQRYQKLFDEAPVGYVVTDPQGVIQNLNRAACVMLGVDVAWAPGKPLAIFVAQAQRPKVRDALLGMRAAAPRPMVLNLRLGPLNDPRVDVEATAALMDVREGSVGPGVRWILRDITADKMAAKALKDSEERFRALTMASSDVLYRMSPDWSEMLQLRSQEFLAETPEPDRDWLAKYIPSDVQPRVLAAINEAIRTKSVFELEHAVLRADGRRGWTFSRAIPVLDASGEIVEWFGAASDVSARKEAEEALRQTRDETERRAKEMEEREHMLGAMMEHIPMGIVIADAPNVKICAVSRHGRELTGRKRQQVEGIPVGHLSQRWEIYRADGVTPARDEELPLARATQKGEVVRDEVWVLGRPDGTRIHILCTGAPIRDSQGNLTGGVVAWQEITEPKRVEEALRRSRASKRRPH